MSKNRSMNSVKSMTGSGLLKAMNNMDIQSERSMLDHNATSSQAMEFLNMKQHQSVPLETKTKQEPNVISNLIVEEEEPLEDFYFGDKKNTEAQKSERKRVKELGVFLYGGGKLNKHAWVQASNALQSKINMFSERFQITNKKIVPTPNFQPPAFFTYFRIFDLRSIDIRALTYTLIKAIVELSLQGCKVCTGFGHSYLKCPTYLLLFGHGHQNRFIKYGLEVAISNMDPDLTNFNPDIWQFQSRIQTYIEASILHSNQSTNKIKRQYIDACSIDLSQVVSRAKKTQCYTCNGYGHATTKNPISTYSKKTQSNQTSFIACPTKANMELKLGGHKGAIDQFIEYKKLLYKGKTDKDQFYMEQSDNEVEIAQQPQPVRPKIETALQLNRYYVAKAEDESDNEGEDPKDLNDDGFEKVIQDLRAKRQHTGEVQQIGSTLKRTQIEQPYQYLVGSDAKMAQKDVYGILKHFGTDLNKFDVEMTYEPINLQKGYQDMAYHKTDLPDVITPDYVAAVLETMTQRQGTTAAKAYIDTIFAIYLKVHKDIQELENSRGNTGSFFGDDDVETKIYQLAQIHRSLDQFIAQYFGDDLKVTGKVDQLPQLFNVKIKTQTASSEPNHTVKIPQNMKPGQLSSNLGKRSYDTMDQEKYATQQVKWSNLSKKQPLTEALAKWGMTTKEEQNAMIEALQKEFDDPPSDSEAPDPKKKTL